MNREILEQNLHEIIGNIERARYKFSDKHIVKIIAVTKSVDTKVIKTLFEIGQRAIGENRVQDMLLKHEALESLPIEWHFIGRLQTNKINSLLSLNPTLIHSIDSFDLACEIDKRANKKVNGLLQINSANEDSKTGVSANEAVDIFKKISLNCKNIELKGVMSIGANVENVALIKESFLETRAIFDNLSNEFDIKYCSMGMSGDYELAIECGSNMVRIGSSFYKD